ncbi:Crp/Fnr family transcriptional regulator [Campylobacter hyointestinalis]|uniref:Crp/Fnr family transcriptional regulator n=1 Tax=Campylobacter hyointestinalis TaxID=198 RepID=UPI0025548F21|nr:Crp/Fnr family transcriptional regulator [Campylobacter hyointestinalis]MDL2347314.1 Crp/Fnr family transcriptional regulator [Campylobacter hyointestinalis]MDL2349056.1 Crp/Fnr family transcriptional regulator [Campylobacter hyointestinalis]MDL2350608.1 Crp/Fnr family transcriptional regulator [Campylobacter hyointestinalis]MDM1026633.1 Crp/Fnr family transcriptional regulator [Campylobacter hyointestinalis]MDM1028061.1 Crp/Fnr family transcriptional regulator [Campylobacter hyointestinali
MKSFKFYSLLSPQNRQILDKNSIFVKIEVGSELYRQGDECPKLMFLTKGRVRVVRTHESGQSILLYYFSQGEQCNVNFTSTLNSVPAIGTAIAETDLEGYIIPTKIIAKMFVDDGAFQRYVFDQYAKRMEYLAALIEDIRFLGLDTRLLHYLQSQKSRIINLSHEELANIIGTSREVISRILKSFENNGIVKLSRKKIELM